MERPPCEAEPAAQQFPLNRLPIMNTQSMTVTVYQNYARLNQTQAKSMPYNRLISQMCCLQEIINYFSDIC